MAVDEKPFLIELAQELLTIQDDAHKRKEKALEAYRLKLQLAEKMEAEKPKEPAVETPATPAAA